MYSSSKLTRPQDTTNIDGLRFNKTGAGLPATTALIVRNRDSTLKVS